MYAIKRKNAFTLIELLVVVAIISALVGVLSVAQRKVKYHARTLRQKAEFHGMDISIELFSTDFNGYPDSDMINGGSDYTCGAQRLAEAMLGRDEQGFHPKSRWHPDLEPTPPDNLYFTDATLKQRKPQYFQLKHSGFYTLGELWDGHLGTELHGPSPVLTDVFNFNRVTIGGETVKVGSPVLYFKADPSKKFRVDAANREITNPSPADYAQWVYDLSDNIEILELPWLREVEDVAPTAGTAIHYKDPDDPAKDSARIFYEQLTQRATSAGSTDFFKPYNQDTFILISAGWDGIFGTKDDVTNYNY